MVKRQRCQKCLKSCIDRPASVADFKQEHCTGVPAAAHPSHMLMRHLGSIVCTLCGRWARDRLVGLRGECTGRPTQSGKAILSKVSRGRPL